jgi:microcystin-dependent protein
MGEISGSENVTLLGSNVPTHNHVFNATTTAASTATAGPTVLLGTLEGTQTFYATAGATDVRPVQIGPTAIGTMGGNTPHNNIQPSMGLTFIVCLAGVFPSRN